MFWLLWAKYLMEGIEVTRLFMGSLLTSHLRATYDAAVNKRKDCASYNRAYKDPRFTALRTRTCVPTAHWATQSNVTSWINRVLRDGPCHEACSRRHSYDSDVLPEYGVLMGCQHGHSRLVLSEVQADCVSTLESV